MRMRRIALITLILTALLGASMPSRAEVVDKIAVIVNSEVITQSEIDRMVEPIYQQYRTIYAGDELIEKVETARQKVIEQLIDDKLLLSEAKRQNVAVDDKEIESMIEDMKRRFDSPAEFEEALLEQNLALKDLRTRYREQRMVRKLVDQKIGYKIDITPIEVREYYDKHIKEFSQPEEIKLRNILIRPKDDEGVQKAIDLANEISRRIAEGGDFGGLAREYSEGPYASEGGLMGYVKKDDLLPEIAKVVFDMKEGEVSGIVQTGLGYHIFKVEEKRPERMMELSEVRRDIEEAIFRIKVKDKIKTWVQGLKKNAYIAFK